MDKDHPSGIVDVIAPISGVITDQQVTNAGGVQGLSGANPFTISDLSYVWIICDVYENDLDAVHLGEYADIHLNAYPNKLLKGRVDNILPALDPSLRTAKVRLEVPNSERLMLVGMFVTVSRPKRGRQFQRLRFFICTIASGFTCRRKPANFAEWK